MNGNGDLHAPLLDKAASARVHWDYSIGDRPVESSFAYRPPSTTTAARQVSHIRPWQPWNLESEWESAVSRRSSEAGLMRLFLFKSNHAVGIQDRVSLNESKQCHTDAFTLC